MNLKDELSTQEFNGPGYLVAQSTRQTGVSVF